MKKGWEFEIARKEEAQRQKEAEERAQRNATFGCLIIFGAATLGVFLFASYEFAILFAPTYSLWIRYLFGAGITVIIMAVLFALGGDPADIFVRILLLAFFVGCLVPVFVRTRENAQRHKKALQSLSRTHRHEERRAAPRERK